MFLLMWFAQELAECPDISDVGSPYILMILLSPTPHLPNKLLSFQTTELTHSLVIMSYATTKSEQTCYRFRTFFLFKIFLCSKSRNKEYISPKLFVNYFYQ
jgi:hypothetical protein